MNRAEGIAVRTCSVTDVTLDAPASAVAESVYPASEAYWRHNQELANIRWISVYTPIKDTAGEVVGAIDDEQADRDEFKRSSWSGSVGLAIDRFSAVRHPLSTPAHR